MKLNFTVIHVNRTNDAHHHSPCVKIRSRLPGTVWRGLIFSTTDRPQYILKCPYFPGTITAEWFWLCVRSQWHHISRMRTFDENSCAISITSLRSLFHPRTQQVWWDHREKSRRASTLWDCRGKSHLTGLSLANGTQCERGDWGKEVFMRSPSESWLGIRDTHTRKVFQLLFPEWPQVAASPNPFFTLRSPCRPMKKWGLKLRLDWI